MEESRYQQILEDLRELYKQRNFKELKNKYRLCRWMIRPEDREKIDPLIGFFEEPKETRSITRIAIEDMGCKLID